MGCEVSNRSERKTLRWRKPHDLGVELLLHSDASMLRLFPKRFRCTVKQWDDIRVYDPDTRSKQPAMVHKFTRAASAQDAAEQMKRMYGTPFVFAELDLNAAASKSSKTPACKPT